MTDTGNDIEVYEGRVLPATRTAADLPIVPLVLKSWTTARSETVRVSRRAGHTVAYHLVHTPHYWAILSSRAPRGLARIILRASWWAGDREGRLFYESLPNEDTLARVNARHDHHVLRSSRRKRTAVTVIVGGATLTLLTLSAPWWALLAASVIVPPVLGLMGRKADAEPVAIKPVKLESIAPVVTDSLIITALEAIGVPGATIYDPPHRESGIGYRFAAQLPAGKAAKTVKVQRDQFASAILRNTGQVWLEVGEQNAGMLAGFVADTELHKRRRPQSPYVNAARVNAFEAVQVGDDPKGVFVSTTHEQRAFVRGGMPGSGKTYSTRGADAALALDPRVDFWIFEMKGTGDYSAFKRIACRYVSGDEDEDIEYAIEAARDLRVEMRRRLRIVKNLVEKDPMTPKRVTETLVNDRNYNLSMIKFIVDECQVLFEHKTHGPEFKEIFEDIIRRGRAALIVPDYMTQRPDAASLPPQISNNASHRVCFRVRTHQANDMALGTGSHREGYSATVFSPDEVGFCIYLGESGEHQTIRMFNVTEEQVFDMVERGYQLRLGEDRLSGDALGDKAEDEPDTDSILNHVMAVLIGRKGGVWYEELPPLLAKGDHANLYENVGQDAIAKSLRDKGVQGDDINLRIPGGTKRATRRGFRMFGLEDALAKQNAERGTWPQQSDVNPDVDEPSKEI